jgi:hypothetical protein
MGLDIKEKNLFRFIAKVAIPVLVRNRVSRICPCHVSQSPWPIRIAIWLWHYRVAFSPQKHGHVHLSCTGVRTAAVQFGTWFNLLYLDFPSKRPLHHGPYTKRTRQGFTKAQSPWTLNHPSSRELASPGSVPAHMCLEVHQHLAATTSVAISTPRSFRHIQHQVNIYTDSAAHNNAESPPSPSLGGGGSWCVQGPPPGHPVNAAPSHIIESLS